MRSYQPLFWQYIKWINFSKYIDIQKSRQYKSFINKKNKSSSFSINSPIVILFAIRDSLFTLNLTYNDFELGYLLFCCINVIDLDISFFYYYRNKRQNNVRKNSQVLLAKVKYYIIASFLDSYLFYLRYIISLSSLRLFNQNPIIRANSVFQYNKYNYYLFVDIKKYMTLTFLSTSLNKIVSSKIFRDILLKFLDLDYLNNWFNYFTVSKGLLFQTNDLLFRKIQEMLVLDIYYEIFTLFNFYLRRQYDNNHIVGFYYNSCIWIYASNTSSLILLRKIILRFLLSTFISKQSGQIKVSSDLLKGIVESLYIVNTKKKLFVLYSIIQPPLIYQFLLIKQVSLTLYNSKSIAIFLTNIRLNMLCLLWFNILSKQLTYKVLYLLDYCIFLKLKALYLPINYSHNTIIHISRRYSIKYKVNTLLKKQYLYYCQALYSNKYYKFYFLIKLVWMYLLK